MELDGILYVLAFREDADFAGVDLADFLMRSFQDNRRLCMEISYLLRVVVDDVSAESHRERMSDRFDSQNYRAVQSVFSPEHRACRDADSIVSPCDTCLGSDCTRTAGSYDVSSCDN